MIPAGYHNKNKIKDDRGCFEKWNAGKGKHLKKSLFICCNNNNNNNNNIFIFIFIFLWGMQSGHHDIIYKNIYPNLAIKKTSKYTYLSTLYIVGYLLQHIIKLCL